MASLKMAGPGGFRGSLSGAGGFRAPAQWDGWPHKVEIPVNKPGDALWSLPCETTNPTKNSSSAWELLLPPI
jgi:hypothetical protein